MKSKNNLQKTIRNLRKIIDTTQDPATKRMAYFVENTLRWAIEDTRGWPRPEEELYSEVDWLKKELSSDIERIDQ